MPARLRATLGENTDVKVVIVERNDVIGPDLGAGPRPVIEEALGSLGVTLRLAMWRAPPPMTKAITR